MEANQSTAMEMLTPTILLIFSVLSMNIINLFLIQTHKTIVDILCQLMAKYQKVKESQKS